MSAAAPRTRPIALWLAIHAWAVLALLPGPGLVICLQSTGAIDVGIGMHSGCPCRPDADGKHPPCTDVHIEGVRDRLPADVPVPVHALLAFVAIDFTTPIGIVPLVERHPTTRAGPPRRSPAPATERALEARRSVVMTV